MALPGDTMTWTRPSTVSAAGEVDGADQSRSTSTTASATHEVSVPWPWDVDVRGPERPAPGRLAHGQRPEQAGAAPRRAVPAEIAIADPRGLAARTVRENAQHVAGAVLAEYALGAADAQPTLLAAGPLGAPAASTASSTGMTHPSGATEVWLATLPAVAAGLRLADLPVPARAGRDRR